MMQQLHYCDKDAHIIAGVIPSIKNAAIDDCCAANPTSAAAQV